MSRTARPTPDENARAAAVRLQIATGWYVSTSGGRVTPRLTPEQADLLADIYTSFKRGGDDEGPDEGDAA